MGLLDAYASGSDSEEEEPVGSKVQAPAKPTTTTKAKKRGPVRITLDLPKSSGVDNNEDGAGSGDEHAKEQPPAKKHKLAAGKGSSALLGMLPPPKRALPVSAGGTGGLIGQRSSAQATTSKLPAADVDSDDEKPVMSANAKGKGKLSAPAVDLFGLATAAPTSTAEESIQDSLPESVFAAPEVADYVPPEPTINDPYPGFYQRPSGEWAAYDSEYYESFFRTMLQQPEAEDNRRGRDFEDLNGVDRDGLQSFDVATGVDKDRKAREEAMKLTAPKTFEDLKGYKMIKPAGKSAGRSHQLSSLIAQAHENRAMLEERIAANKRSSRAAGARYGF